MRLTDFNRRLSSSILKLLIDDRCTTHAERVNNNNKFIELVVSDIVVVKTAIPSDAFTNRVAKLNYQVRGPFRIVKFTCRGNYLVRK